MRLHRPPNSPNSPGPEGGGESSREPGRLIFPRAALDKARRECHQEGERIPRRQDVAGRIDQLLDKMQGQLDALKHDADADAAARFRFPTPLASTDDDGDWTPPSRAA